MTAARTDRLEILGLPLDRVGVEDVHAFIGSTVAAGRKAMVLHLNIHGVNLALKHGWLRECFRSADLVFCDGDGVRLGLRIVGHRPPPKITYNEWLWQLAAFCEIRELSMYLLGGTPGVADEAARRLRERCPALSIRGTHDGFFAKDGEENRKVVEKINEVAPDILLVCFGMPLQERWIADNWSRLDVRIALSGGAALDYASGRVAKAPAWMVRGQLEWLFRLVQQPRRLFSRYVIGNPLFLSRVVRARLFSSRPDRAS